MSGQTGLPVPVVNQSRREAESVTPQSRSLVGRIAREKRRKVKSAM